MKLNKQISELVQSNFVAVEEANEGLLRGDVYLIFICVSTTRVGSCLFS